MRSSDFGHGGGGFLTGFLGWGLAERTSKTGQFCMPKPILWFANRNINLRELKSIDFDLRWRFAVGRFDSLYDFLCGRFHECVGVHEESDINVFAQCVTIILTLWYPCIHVMHIRVFSGQSEARSKVSNGNVFFLAPISDFENQVSESRSVGWMCRLSMSSWACYF